MNPENALALVDRVCGMVSLNRDDHIKVAQAIEILKQAITPPNQPPENES